jgi:hypothetical protein
MSGRFLSTTYLDEIRGRVQRGDEPWAVAHGALLDAAAKAMDQEPLSVRDSGGSPWFRVDGVYVPGKDGVVNTEANMDDRIIAARASKAATDLALAWRFTGETGYADKALEMVHVWCINRNTYMFPTGGVVDAATPGAVFGGDVVLFHAMQGLFLACHLLRDYQGWDMLARAGVKRWIKDMTDAQRELMYFNGREMYNNWEGARLVYLAHGALALDDLDLLGYVFDRYRHTLPMAMTPEGELPRETMRTRSMTYTLAALKHMADIAEIARQYGIDLWDLEINGRCLKKGIDFAGHYLLNIDEWPFQLIHPLSEELTDSSRLGLFEMAHARWG